MIEITSKSEFKFEPPAGLNIFRLRRPETTETAIHRIGRRFGMRTVVEAGTFTHNARGSAYSEPSGWEVKLFRQSGGWQYRHATRWQADDGKGHLSIKDDHAGKLAVDAIRQFALPVEPELDLLHVQRLHVAHAQRNGANHEERIIGARVLFRRLLKGVPVEGPGGRTIVYLDHKQELTGIDHLWRDIEAVHEPVMRLRPVEEAYEEVRRRYAHWKQGHIEVTDVRLGYFEMGWDEDQDYLQPAYVVFIRLGGAEGPFRMNGVVPVAAAANAVGPIEQVRSARMLQPIRNR